MSDILENLILENKRVGRLKQAEIEVLQQDAEIARLEQAETERIRLKQ